MSGKHNYLKGLVFFVFFLLFTLCGQTTLAATKTCKCEYVSPVSGVPIVCVTVVDKECEAYSTEKSQYKSCVEMDSADCDKALDEAREKNIKESQAAAAAAAGKESADSKDEAASDDLVAELRGDIQQLNKLGTTDPAVLIGRIIKVVMGIMGSIALVMFVYSGFVLMTGSTAVGGGATKKDITKAKGMLVWSTLGIFVIFASYALVDFIFEIFR